MHRTRARETWALAEADEASVDHFSASGNTGRARRRMLKTTFVISPDPLSLPTAVVEHPRRCGAILEQKPPLKAHGVNYAVGTGATNQS
jgi:hypothetical protein